MWAVKNLLHHLFETAYKYFTYWQNKAQKPYYSFLHSQEPTGKTENLYGLLPSQWGAQRGREETGNVCAEKEQSCYERRNLGPSSHQIMRNFLLLISVKLSFIC